ADRRSVAAKRWKYPLQRGLYLWLPEDEGGGAGYVKARDSSRIWQPELGGTRSGPELSLRRCRVPQAGWTGRIRNCVMNLVRLLLTCLTWIPASTYHNCTG